jgi:predicted nuclease of restriction endonuclease-like (RecB) superfamily
MPLVHASQEEQPKLDIHIEADLERALLNNLQAFLLGLGRGFAFVGRQYIVSTESKDFYVDLVFYNYLLKCFVLFELSNQAS